MSNFVQNLSYSLWSLLRDLAINPLRPWCSVALSAHERIRIFLMSVRVPRSAIASGQEGFVETHALFGVVALKTCLLKTGLGLLDLALEVLAFDQVRNIVLVLPIALLSLLQALV